MRTTVTIDDDLIIAATEFSGIEEKSRLLNFVLDTYVKRMAAKRLAALGSCMPDLDITPRSSRVTYPTPDTFSSSKVAEEK